MSRWQTLSSEEVYTTPWIKVRRDEVITKNGKPLTYSVISLQHPSVFILAVNNEGHVLVQQSYRYTLDKVMWEIPAGHSDGEALLDAAKRELYEETGLSSDNWSDLGRLYQATGIGNIPLQVFVAAQVTGTLGKTDKEEDIMDHKFISIRELEAMALQGALQESPVLAALYLAKIHGFIKETK
jgi:8-oxo-dGTP pyrophosphatase MutT (NUDIX family)